MIVPGFDAYVMPNHRWKSEILNAVYLRAEGYGATWLRRRDEEVEELDRHYTFTGELSEEDGLEHSDFRRIAP